MGTESDHIEINSSVDDTHVSADGKLETPNIEISDVTENSDDNLESLLEIKEKLSSNYMKIYELPAENKIAENNNIEISKLLTEENDHEEEIEMIKVSSNIINKGDDFDSEFLLEEDNLIEWFSESKSNLFPDIEDEQGIELVRECKNKDKAYNCKEIDDLNDNTINKVIFLTTLEEEELDKWLIKTDNPLNLEESDSVFNFETVSEKNNLGDWITRAETDSVEDKSGRIAKKTENKEQRTKNREQRTENRQ